MKSLNVFFSYHRFGQICVLVAVAILEDCCMAFANMQVSELWPMGLLFYFILHILRIKYIKENIC